MQPTINLKSFESIPGSLKQRLKALERKQSLGAPGLVQGLLRKDELRTQRNRFHKFISFGSFSRGKRFINSYIKLVMQHLCVFLRRS